MIGGPGGSWQRWGQGDGGLDLPCPSEHHIPVIDRLLEAPSFPGIGTSPVFPGEVLGDTRQVYRHMGTWLSCDQVVKKNGTSWETTPELSYCFKFKKPHSIRAE